MELFVDLWGLSLNQSIFFLSIILIIIDLFFPTDFPTHIAYILLCMLIGINIPAHILIKIIISILAWLVLVAFHYLIWKSVVQWIIDHIIAPNHYMTGGDDLIGEKGEIREIDGNKMVRVRGDLWSFSSHGDLENGDIVNIVVNNSGILEVKQTER